MDKPLLVHADWDDEAGVWVATSDDVPASWLQRTFPERASNAYSRPS